MAIVLSDEQVRRMRLRAQGLDRRKAAVMPAVDPTTTFDAVTAVTMAMCGIQAQYIASAALAVRARAVGLVTASDIDSALIEDGRITRTWLMRGTLHLVETSNYVSWLPLLGPHMIASDQRRPTQLGLDDATCERALPLIGKALARRVPVTRGELAAALAPHDIPTAGQALPHLLYYAAFQGILCCGPDRAGGPTYLAPFHTFAHRVTLNHLAVRYLTAYGPARPEDFASWAGVPVNLARASWRALADYLVEVEHGGQPMWIAKTRARWLDDLDSTSDGAPLVNLIPAYDPYLLGYQRRDLVLAPEYARRVHPGGGVLHNVLLVNGQAQGIWSTKQRRDRLEIKVEPFAPLAPDVANGVEAEVADIGRFYATRAELHLRNPE